MIIKNKKGQVGQIIVILIGGLIILSLLIYILGYSLTTGSEIITIKEKWVKYHGDDAKYLVSSTNEQVFQITDTFFYWRFDSSDLYTSLDEGETCKIKTQGWRFPFFSNYKNILSVSCN